MKKEWLIDLLKLLRFHDHFNKDVLKEAFGISDEIACQFILQSALSSTRKKIKFKHIENL